jgi:hypothetical protein
MNWVLTPDTASDKLENANVRVLDRPLPDTSRGLLLIEEDHLEEGFFLFHCLGEIHTQLND